MTGRDAAVPAFDGLGPDARVALIRSGYRIPGTGWQRVRAVLALGRPRTCIPGLICYALGVSYTGPASAAAVIAGGVLAFLIGFIANLHNAYTDLEEDALNLPGRGYLLLVIGYRRLPRILAAITAGMVAASVPLGAEFFLFMVLAQIGLNQYSAPPFRTKSRPILGLWVFAQAVVFPFLFGVLLAPRELLFALVSRALGGELAPASAADAFDSLRGLAMLAFLTVWFMAKGLVKNVPDYYGDRAAHIRTSATMFVSYRSAATFAVVAVVATISSLAALVALGLEPPRLALALVWLAPIGWNAWRLRQAPDTAAANRILAFDMVLSSGFIATVLLLIAPVAGSLACVLVALAVFAGSDALGFDSRRAPEVAVRRVES
jgi:4-hydroxybenzoate polyprenyltransferase